MRTTGVLPIISRTFANTSMNPGSPLVNRHG